MMQRISLETLRPRNNGLVPPGNGNGNGGNKIIYETSRQVKSAYRKRGGSNITEAEKRRIERLRVLDERAEKIRQKEERKKQNTLKRKMKDDKEGGKKKVVKLTSSQPDLSGFFGMKPARTTDESDQNGVDEVGREEGDGQAADPTEEKPQSENEEQAHTVAAKVPTSNNYMVDHGVATTKPQALKEKSTNEMNGVTSSPLLRHGDYAVSSLGLCNKENKPLGIEPYPAAKMRQVPHRYPDTSDVSTRDVSSLDDEECDPVQPRGLESESEPILVKPEPNEIKLKPDTVKIKSEPGQIKTEPQYEPIKVNPKPEAVNTKLESGLVSLKADPRPITIKPETRQAQVLGKPEPPKLKAEPKLVEAKSELENINSPVQIKREAEPKQAYTQLMTPARIRLESPLPEDDDEMYIPPSAQPQRDDHAHDWALLWEPDIIDDAGCEDDKGETPLTQTPINSQNPLANFGLHDTPKSSPPIVKRSLQHIKQLSEGSPLKHISSPQIRDPTHDHVLNLAPKPVTLSQHPRQPKTPKSSFDIPSEEWDVFTPQTLAKLDGPELTNRSTITSCNEENDEDDDYGLEDDDDDLLLDFKAEDLDEGRNKNASQRKTGPDNEETHFAVSGYTASQQVYAAGLSDPAFDELYECGLDTIAEGEEDGDLITTVPAAVAVSKLGLMRSSSLACMFDDDLAEAGLC